MLLFPLIHIKMPTIVGIYEQEKGKNIYEQEKFHAELS